MQFYTLHYLLSFIPLKNIKVGRGGDLLLWKSIFTTFQISKELLAFERLKNIDFHYMGITNFS